MLQKFCKQYLIYFYSLQNAADQYTCLMAEANQEKENLRLEVSYVELTLLFDFIN
jgi:hypothetical protein